MTQFPASISNSLSRLLRRSKKSLCTAAMAVAMAVSLPSSAQAESSDLEDDSTEWLLSNFDDSDEDDDDEEDTWSPNSRKLHKGLKKAIKGLPDIKALEIYSVEFDADDTLLGLIMEATVQGEDGQEYFFVYDYVGMNVPDEWKEAIGPTRCSIGRIKEAKNKKQAHSRHKKIRQLLQETDQETLCRKMEKRLQEQNPNFGETVSCSAISYEAKNASLVLYSTWTPLFQTETPNPFLGDSYKILCGHVLDDWREGAGLVLESDIDFRMPQESQDHIRWLLEGLSSDDSEAIKEVRTWIKKNLRQKALKKQLEGVDISLWDL